MITTAAPQTAPRLARAMAASAAPLPRSDIAAQQRAGQHIADTL